MSARCSLVVNGRSLRVATGDTALEDALADGVIAPMQALHGASILGQAAPAAARRIPPRERRGEAVKLDLATGGPSLGFGETETPAASVRRSGSITEMTRLCPGIVQAIVSLVKPLDHEPGHQVELIAGHAPPVTVTPSLRVDGTCDLNEMVLHLPCEGGVFVGSLADTFQLGQTVTVKGPTGRGHYRRGGGRLVLIADEAGFAGIWAIARAARYIEPMREMSLVVGARDPLDLYMGEALDWLKATGIRQICRVADRHRQRPPDVRPGPLTAHVPPLRANDAVYVSGRPGTVGAVEVLAGSVGARCYPIPLDPML